MVLLLPNALRHKRMQKYVKSNEQENYCNAELLCEEVIDIFTEGIKKQ
jgi:hypothetical protein